MIPALIIILIGILLLKAALKPHHIYQPSNSIFKKIAESVSKNTAQKEDISRKNNLSEEDNTSAKNNSAVNKNISPDKSTSSSNTSQTAQKNMQQNIESDSEIILSTKEGKNKIIHYGPSVDMIELLKDYNTIEELIQDADNIVLGTVKEKNSYMDEEGTAVYTDYSVELKKVYKGKLKEKENIHITDLGGRIKASEYFAKQADPKFKKAKEQAKKNPDTTYVQYNFGSNWQPEISNQYLWFLTSDNSDNQTTYTPLNSWQGVYRLTANKKEQYFQRYTTPDYEDNAAQITLVKMEKKLK